MSEAFIAKLDSNLTTILDATYLGGSDFERSLALALDGTANVYVAGGTDSSDFPGISPGSADSAFQGDNNNLHDNEAFVAKLDPDLSSILGLLFHLRDFIHACIPCPPEPKKVLISKIELAISHFEKGNERPIGNALRSFIHKTEQFVRSGKLPEAEGRLFIAMAEEIISAAEAEAGETTQER